MCGKRVVFLVTGFLLWGAVAVQAGDLEKGRKLFFRYCNFCHPGGRNVMRREKDLRRKTLMANGINGPEGIVKKMRHPGPGMPRFSEENIPDEDARAIARYVWETFAEEEK